MSNLHLPKVPKKITPAFGFSYISERALREGLGRRRFGPSEMNEVVRWFHYDGSQPACGFWGTIEIARWDHLVPIRNGGETVLGNMVLACQPCDDSKGTRSFKDWIIGTALKSPRTRQVSEIEQRVERLDSYMMAFQYVPRRLEERLTEAEQDSLHQLRSDLARLRKEVEDFIQKYQARQASIKRV